MSKPLEIRLFAPIRLTEGGEWINVSGLAWTSSDAQSKAAEDDAKCGPAWLAANPVVRIAEILIQEVTE